MSSRSLMGAAGLLVIVMLVTAACAGAADTGAVLVTDDPVVEPPADANEQAAPAGVEMAEPTSETDDLPEPTAEPAEDASGATTFVIVGEESEVRFVLDEVLNGADTTVVGATNAVEGQMVVDYANPAGSTVQNVRVDLSTLRTDNSFRNRAIHDFILRTGNEDLRYADFTATGVSGLPEMVTVGQSFEFQLTGDLTINSVTQQVTFDATATPVSDSRLEGTASLTVPYSDFGVNIPRLPEQVASVEDNVTLEIDFVAVPVQ